eukprot:gnl/MRDRNA2_/MRDRNA2_19090_c0_seq1.p1 gnl/MRDRNA2_/MRDRNA2_19090_c0~~gnl/MRDRNA2_/MRDRNA2_19090_c0_seq1.p1  ORF type:complete len:412 (+),score=59.91 gnl/MRDRNA2_/MRDRNA2_19090_c0_seq1:103-1338(+)
MHRVTIGFLIALLTQALVNGTGPSPKSARELAEELIHRSLQTVLGSKVNEVMALPDQHADLEHTVLAKDSTSIAKDVSNLKVKSRPEQLRILKQDFGITGQTIANGKYLLCDRPQRSTSGRSKIYGAYRADPNGFPTGAKLAIKVSSDCESLACENKNYDRITFGLFPGCFINKIEFLPEFSAEPASFELKSKCALVMEAGRTDLQAILAERGGRGLEGRALRDAAASAAQCIQAVHSSGMVWSDLKTQNFVVVGSEIGDSGFLSGVKGIDLESSKPHKSKPDVGDFKYTPEACPPEFAREVISGSTEDFVLDYSFDIFSYGLLLYELATGSRYFASMRGGTRIVSQLASEDFQVDLSAIEDGKLQDLIQQCLSGDPKKRPNIVQILLHPYFVTTGIGPYGFPGPGYLIPS